jgi:CRISPR-associated protein Cas5, subtype I-B/TNEAP
MKQYRIKISSWTAGFRYPNLISGVQPTLEVPPISTVLGLINAASGKYLEHEQLKLGYYFEYESKATDLETVYQIELHNKGYPLNSTKSNVLNREFLFNCKLFIYTADREIVDYLSQPYYSLLLGRSGDLATVEQIEEVELKECKNAKNIKGQIVPFKENHLPGLIQPLPQYFTDSVPRRNLKTVPYSIISCNAKSFLTNITAYSDVIEGKEIDIYFHELNFKND